MQKKIHELEKKKRNDLKNSRLEEEYTKIENQTDSMDARDYMKIAKETAKLKARANALHEMDTHFEEGVDKLKKVEGGQLNFTNEEKEQLAEEVQDDMMKLDVEVSKLLSVLSSVLFCFVVFCSVLFCFVLFCSVFYLLFPTFLCGCVAHSCFCCCDCFSLFIVFFVLFFYNSLFFFIFLTARSCRRGSHTSGDATDGERVCESQSNADETKK